jgi:hypothetical protein
MNFPIRQVAARWHRCHRALLLGLDASVNAAEPVSPARDDDQEHRGGSRFLAEEQP